MVKVAGMTPEADIGWSAAEPGLCHFPLDTRRKVLGFGWGAPDIYQMDRYPGGQFPYAAFFWPALVAASAAETASSVAAHLLAFSADTDGARTAQEPEGATPSRIALELRAVRLRDLTVVKSGVPTLLCPPLALHGAANPVCRRSPRLPP
jgi:hypothetical protein